MGIKRLGTVISRRRQSTQPLQTGSPAGTPRGNFPQDNASRNLASRDAPPPGTPSRGPASPDTAAGANRNVNASQAASARISPSFFPQQPVREAEETYAPPQGPPPGRAEVPPTANGGMLPSPSPPLTNGMRSSTMGQLQEPLQPQMPSAAPRAVGMAQKVFLREVLIQPTRIQETPKVTVCRLAQRIRSRKLKKKRTRECINAFLPDTQLMVRPLVKPLHSSSTLIYVMHPSLTTTRTPKQPWRLWRRPCARYANSRKQLTPAQR